MASNVPFTRQIAWLPVIVQIIFIWLLIYLFDLAGFTQPFIFAAVTYVILAFLLRNIFAKQHRTGIRLVKQHRFAEAIPYFQKSYAYFSQQSWVDRYRFLTLLSATAMSYREMGLCNIAFCYAQIGEGQKAKEYYQLTLKDYPQNGLAITGLNMLNSFDEQKA